MTRIPGAATTAHLRVLLIDDAPARAAIIERGLSSAGLQLIAVLEHEGDFAGAARAEPPDVIVVCADLLSDEMVKRLRAIQRDQPRPAVLFVGGASGGLIEVVMARCREVQALRAENERLRRALEERKLVERAKGIVMRQRQLGEEDAYRALRRLAMEQNQPLADIARQIIALAAVLDPS